MAMIEFPPRRVSCCECSKWDGVRCTRRGWTNADPDHPCIMLSHYVKQPEAADLQPADRMRDEALRLKRGGLTYIVMARVSGVEQSTVRDVAEKRLGKVTTATLEKWADAMPYMESREGKAMRISDELRQFIDDGELFPNQNDELRCIADRIDNEMVELPKDANGVPIHEGDKMYLDDGRMFVVVCIKFVDNDNPFFYLTDVNRAAYMPAELTHTRPDSFESIADDIKAVEERQGEDNEWRADAVFVSESTLCEWSDRIRKLAKKGER